MIAENRKLPEWAMERGHPFPDHYYYFTDDERLMIRCPDEDSDLDLRAWNCPHERSRAPMNGFKPTHVATVAKMSEGELELRRDEAKENEEDGRYYKQLYDWELRRRKTKELLEAEG